MLMVNVKYKLGYDLSYIKEHGVYVPVRVPLTHSIFVGQTGSGKSMCALNALYTFHKTLVMKGIQFDITVCDYKEAHTFYCVSSRYYTFLKCVEGIKQFYNDFLVTKEGGDGRIKLLLCDEIASLIGYLDVNEKKTSQEIRNILTTLLALGRSRNVFLWQITQRATASLYTASSGALDNVAVKVLLSNSTRDSRDTLFQGAGFSNVKDNYYQRGQGLLSVSGMPLIELQVPMVDQCAIERYFMGYRGVAALSR